MDDLLIKSYNKAQESAIPLDVVNAVLNDGNAGTEVVENKESTTTQPENDEEADEEPTYNIGDYVRCTYSDGVDYEAKIIEINYDKKTCRIRYIGYENEQKVNWNKLVGTWGPEARNAQYEAAKAESTETEFSSKSPKTPKGFNPPPVPPLPPLLFGDDEEKNHQLGQLLISWFMTGYYTGLHQHSLLSSKK